jgi:porphobilinogen synthase
MDYPLRHRPRRLRHSPALRALVAETHLATTDFIAPLFVRHGSQVRIPITSMPGQYQLSVDTLIDEVKQLTQLGITGVLLFGIPAAKDAIGSENFAADGIIPQAIRALKATYPDLLVITDVCMCEYTDHGHCGIINTPESVHYNPALPLGYVINDATLAIIAQVALTHAQAGADVIAPSGMMDGMVASIRDTLDQHGYQHISIISYAIKYASSLYGPFREAAESPPAFGDRHHYQMSPYNQREAMRELALDIAQGADMVMVKPAMAYLDIIVATRQACHLPVAAYQVSGEYAMIHAAAANGWLNLRSAVMESVVAIKRAGADFVITYFAKDIATWLTEKDPA